MSAARRFLEFRPSTVVVKLGASGCLVAARKEIFETPSFEVNVVDVTSAGDAFDAAFLSAILECGSVQMRQVRERCGRVDNNWERPVNPIPQRSVVDDFLRSRISA